MRLAANTTQLQQSPSDSETLNPKPETTSKLGGPKPVRPASTPSALCQKMGVLASSPVLGFRFKGVGFRVLGKSE